MVIKTIKSGRRTNLILLFSIILIQVIFIGRFLYENSQFTSAYLSTAVLVGLLITGFSTVISRHSKLDHPIRMRNKDGEAIHNLNLGDWISLLSCSLGSMVTYYISIDLMLGPIIGASSVGLISSIPLLIAKENKTFKALPVPIYCGSFVGMSASFILTNIFTVGLVGFFAGLLFVGTQNMLIGIGGRLGTIAFMSVTVVFFLSKYLINV